MPATAPAQPTAQAQQLKLKSIYLNGSTAGTFYYDVRNNKNIVITKIKTCVYNQFINWDLYTSPISDDTIVIERVDSEFITALPTLAAGLNSRSSDFIPPRAVNLLGGAFQLTFLVSVNAGVNGWQIILTYYEIDE